MRAARRQRALSLLRWIDSWAHADSAAERRGGSIDWLRVLPFLGVHVACLAVIWVGWSWFAVGTAVALYAVRMFAITAFYHRYFAHRAFRTGRKRQFLFALLGNTAVQRGPLWWAAHHREHHSGADTSDDPHSPSRRGFWWSHVGWILARANFRTRLERVRDLARFPELRFLDRFDTLVPVLFFAALFGFGALLERLAPGLGTSGLQMLVWSLVSTVALFHATFAINSLAHLFGTRRYETRDTSRNSFWLALLTLGEGWHNNHHHYSSSARQGFRWWELDPSWWALVAMRALGLVWDLKPVPAHVLVDARRRP
jgi:stearoyl-CoA desaturase (delta-9 desaturase)